MSHRDDQPYEIEEREVDHGFAINDYAWALAGELGVGTVREREWWGDQRALDEFDAELKRRDEARKLLGGFGFGART